MVPLLCRFGLSLTILAALLGVSANGMVAAAQDAAIIPKDMLELDFQQCRRDCLARTDEATCDYLCDCSTRESFPKAMTFERYLTFRKQAAEGSLAPEFQQMLDRIGKACFDRFLKDGGAIGPAARPEPERGNDTEGADPGS